MQWFQSPSTREDLYQRIYEELAVILLLLYQWLLGVMWW